MKHHNVHRKIKTAIKRAYKFFGKYINGWKGAVSIFLALITAPFLSLTLLIVESARYQSAVELMDEVIDCSAFSVLAEYDSYLEERFGVMAVSQGVGLNGGGGFINGETEFAKYLNDNVASVGVNILNDKAEGRFPLSDSGVLKQQLLENSEVSAAIEMFINGIDLDILFEKLKDAFSGLDDLSKQAEALNASAEVGSAIVGAINEIKEVITKYNDEYVPSYNNYHEKYDNFKKTALELADNLDEFEKNHKEEYDEYNAAKNNEEDIPDPPDPYEDPKVKKAAEDCDKAAFEYSSAVSDFKSDFSILKKKIDSLVSTVAGLPAKINKMRTSVSKCEEAQSGESESSQAVAASGMADASAEWFSILAEEAGNQIEAIFGMSFSTESQIALNKLDEQAFRISNFRAKDGITSETDSSNIKTAYSPIDTSCIPAGLGGMLDKIIRILNQKKPVMGSTEISIEDLLTFLKKIVSVNFLYDPNLNSVVSESAFYQAETYPNLGDLLFGESISDLISSGEKFSESIKSFDILKALEATTDFLVSVVAFLSALIAKTVEMVASVIDLGQMLIDNPGEILNDLLLYSYAAYNLPNRINYDSGKSLSGYSFDKIYTAAGGTSKGVAFGGTFTDLKTFDDSYGSDMMFKGAEGEYILVGTANEKKNQALAAFDLIMFRIVLDIAPVLMNGTVKALASATGPFAPLVYVAMILGEAAVDTVLIVNGVKVYLVKKKDYIYLSPKGVKDLIADTLSMTGISKALQEEITKDDSKNKKDKSEDKILKGFFDADYREYLILLMFLNRCQTDIYLARMKNLIQTEAAVNYKYSHGFLISKAYTYVQTDVEYELKAMFNLESLTGNGLLKVRTSEYHGY